MTRNRALVLLLLISSGCRHAAPDTALTRAAVMGDTERVQALLSQHIDPDACDGSGWAPIHWAARGGHAEVTRVLLEVGANPNARDCGRNQWPPLLHAIHMRQAEAARVLIDGDADVKLRRSTYRVTARHE